MSPRRWLLAFRIDLLDARILTRNLLNRADGEKRDHLRARLEELDRRAARRSAQREINRIASRRSVDVPPRPNPTARPLSLVSKDRP